MAKKAVDAATLFYKRQEQVQLHCGPHNWNNQINPFKFGGSFCYNLVRIVASQLIFEKNGRTLNR